VQHLAVAHARPLPAPLVGVDAGDGQVA
jgi:hypothetical protein